LKFNVPFQHKYGYIRDEWLSVSMPDNVSVFTFSARSKILVKNRKILRLHPHSAPRHHMITGISLRALGVKNWSHGANM